MRTARAMAVLVVALGLAACASGPPRGEAGVRALEQQQLRAALAGDRAALERIFAPEFRLINPSGAIANRDDLLALLASGTPPYRNATYTTEAVREYRDVVVTWGTEDVEFATGAQAGQRQRRRVTQVWERDGGQWRLVQRHATLITLAP